MRQFLFLPHPLIWSYIQELDRILAEDYVPTVQDLLRCRAKTTGIQELHMTIENSKFMYESRCFICDAFFWRFAVSLMSVGSVLNERNGFIVSKMLRLYCSSSQWVNTIYTCTKMRKRTACMNLWNYLMKFAIASGSTQSRSFSSSTRKIFSVKRFTMYISLGLSFPLSCFLFLFCERSPVTDWVGKYHCCLSGLRWWTVVPGRLRLHLRSVFGFEWESSEGGLRAQDASHRHEQYQDRVWRCYRNRSWKSTRGSWTITTSPPHHSPALVYSPFCSKVTQSPFPSLLISFLITPSLSCTAGRKLSSNLFISNW